MKLFIFMLTMSLSFAFSAQAADKKIGNVIAVERSVENVYQDCAAQFTTAPTTLKDTKPKEPSFYTCRFDGKKTPHDFAPTAQRLLSLSNKDCDVEGFMQNSIVLVTVQLKLETPSMAAAKSCLQQALNESANKDSFKFNIYTIE